MNRDFYRDAFAVSFVIAIMLSCNVAFMMTEYDPVSETSLSFSDSDEVVRLTEEEFSLCVDLMILGGVSQSSIDEFTDCYYSLGGVLGDLGEWGSFVVGLVIGASVGFLVGVAVGVSINTSTTDAEEQANYRMLASDLMTSQYEIAMGLFSKLVRNDAQLVRFSQSYWDMQVETRVNSLYRPRSSVTDIDGILYDSGVIPNLYKIKTNIYQAINQVTYDQRDGFWLNTDPLGLIYGIKMGLGWNIDDNISVSGSYSTYIEFGDFVNATSDNNLVYIGVESRPSVLTGLPRANSMYVLGGPAVITEVATGDSYSLLAGYNDLGITGYNIKPGYYVLSSGRSYFSPNLLSSVSSQGCMTLSGFVLHNGNDAYNTYGYVANGVCKIVDPIQDYSVSSIKYTVKALDKNGVPDYSFSDVTRSVLAVDALSSSYNSILVRSKTAALTAWSVLDILEAQSGSYAIRPSTIISGLDDEAYDLPVSTRVALYVTMMKQIALYGADVDYTKILISRETLDNTIFFYGSVDYRGLTLVDHGVFSFVSYIDEPVTIHQGYQSFSSAGTSFLVVYDDDVLMLDEFWEPTEGKFQVVELTNIDVHFDIYDISVDGVLDVYSVTFHPVQAELLGLIDLEFSRHRLQFDRTSEAVSPWMGIAIIGWGFAVLFAGLIGDRKTPFFIILGACVVLLGMLEITMGLVTTIWNFLVGIWNAIVGFFEWIQNPFGWW